MHLEEFLATYDVEKTDFCACVIEENGNLVPCDKGHLATLQEIYGERHPGETLPPEAMRMFWLIVQLKVVVVDYENQVYNEVLTEEQKTLLKRLKERKKINLHLSNLHNHTD